ncbi:MAG: hypothetical protein DWI00_16615, partial [Planctomycetota bacterium]
MLRTVVTLLILSAGMRFLEASSIEDANAILTAARVSGGFVVHLGATNGELTAALRSGESIQVQALIEETATTENARRAIHATGRYGNVSALQFSGETLPYIDNLVNLVVVENQGHVSDEEIQRVLVPNGVVLK